MVALTESHFACHTYPEYQIATFNLYCCRSRPEWGLGEAFRRDVEAEKVSMTKLERGAFSGSDRYLSITAGGDQ